MCIPLHLQCASTIFLCSKMIGQIEKLKAPMNPLTSRDVLFNVLLGRCVGREICMSTTKLRF